MKIIFLAAGKGQRIFKNINKNKCLLEIRKKTLIENSINEILKTKIRDVIIVVGFKPNQIKNKLKNYKNIKFILNKKYNSREMLYSLIFALRKYNSDIIFAYTDIIFSYKTINKIIESDKTDITIPILSNWKKIWKIRNKNPYSDAESLFINNSKQLISIGHKIKRLKEIKYQFMGITFIPQSQRKEVLNFYDEIKVKNRLHLTTFLNKLVKKKFKINCIKTNDEWYEFDDYFDYLNYKKYYQRG
jgi:choline kinase